MTRLLTNCSIAFIVTLVVAIFLPESYLTAAAISLIAVAVLFFILSFFVKQTRNLSIILIFCFISILNVCLYNHNTIKPARALVGTTAEITATITSTEVSQSGNQYYIASLETVEYASVSKTTKICIYPSNHDKLNDYDKIKATVNFFEFDSDSADSYYRSNNINAYSRATSDIIVINQNKFSPLREICKIRDKMTFNIRANMDGETGNIVCSILFGKRDYISKTTSDSFATAGISHVMAVSGLHLSIIIMLLNSLLEFIGVNKKLRFVFCVLASVILLIMTGFTSSTIRAVTMLVFSLAAQNIRRDYDSLTALSISAVLICLFNPYAITNIGFLLSFSATIGLIISQNIIKNIRKKFSLKTVSMPKLILFELSSRIIPCFFAFLFTIPVTACVFGYISVYSVVTNFLLSALFTIVLGLSLMVAILSLFPIPISFLYNALEFIVAIIAWVAEKVSTLPYSRIFIQSELTLPVVITISILFIIAAFSKNRKINIAYATVCSVFLISFAVMINTLYYSGTTQISLTPGEPACVLIKSPIGKIISGYNKDADYELKDFANNSADANVFVMAAGDIPSSSVSKFTHFILDTDVSNLSVSSDIAPIFSATNNADTKCYLSNGFTASKGNVSVSTQSHGDNSVTFIDIDGFKIAHLTINSSQNLPEDFSCDLLIANAHTLLVIEHYKHNYFLLSEEADEQEYLREKFAENNVYFIGDINSKIMIKNGKVYSKQTVCF